MNNYQNVKSKDDLLLVNNKKENKMNILLAGSQKEIIGSIYYCVGLNMLEEVNIPLESIEVIKNLLKRFKKPLLIENFFLYEDYRGKGYSKRILESLDDELNKENIDYVFLFPYPLYCNNEHERLKRLKVLIQLYKDCGYELQGAFESLNSPIPIGVIYGKELADRN